MFKHILVATDGSDLAANAVATSIALARSCGARITALMVVPDYNAVDYASVVIKDGESGSQLRLQLAGEGQRRLDEALAYMDDTDVQLDRRVAVCDRPYERILACAADLGCDLIVMATRGRGALAATLLGSQTLRVLAGSKTPVLVVK